MNKKKQGKKFVNTKDPGGGGGDSHMKQTGMLVVGFWSRLGCSGQSAYISSYTTKVSFRVPRGNTELR